MSIPAVISARRWVLRAVTLGLAAGALLPGVARAQPLGDPAQRGLNTPAVWRPDTGTWYLRSSFPDEPGSATTISWGLKGDLPVPADFTGDRKSEVAVWRPATGTWYVMGTGGGPVTTRQWGLTGDVPLPRDYDGDGKADYAVWRPSTATWYIVDSSTGNVRTQQWGLSSDIPVPADFSADGRVDLAVWRPSEGRWYIMDSATGATSSIAYGLPGDVPVPADYSGDGRADWAVWRPSNATWYILDGVSRRQRTQQIGQAGDVPVPADYDGVPGADLGVWRPSTGRWFSLSSRTDLPNGSAGGVQFGLSGDMPVPGNFTGDGAFTSPYPTVAPDFTDPTVVHAPLFSAKGGDNDRPLLVVYVDFDDRPAPSSITPASYAQLFFGTGFGSMAGYFAAQSYGKLNLSAAAETDGTANDGIVHVRLKSYNGFWAQLGPQRGRLALDAADAKVDFARFDRNGDGRVGEDELIIVSPVVHNSLDCGQTLGIAAGALLDGKQLGTRTYSGVVNLTNPITVAHEISHQALDVVDYDYIQDPFDLHGFTCTLPMDTWFGYGAWHRMHFGWTAPTVVTRDQFYRIDDAAGSGDAYILYDPWKGSQNYLLVENRERSSYDKTVRDQGLVVWRVDESRYGTSPIDIVPAQPGRPDMAWDPSDSATPGRTAATPWKDGSASNVAIRAIGDRGGSMWAYFDVRGPGVLVDAYALKVQHATAGVARDVTFPVRNTGEKTDTFAFTLAGLPAGWTATTVVRTLAASAESTVTVKLMPAASAPNGLFSARATGQSMTDLAVGSDSPFEIALP